MDALRRDLVSQRVAQKGVFIQSGTARDMRCTTCSTPLCLKHGMGTELPDSMYVHTIGNPLKGLPELLVLCGKGPLDPAPLGLQEVLLRLADAEALVKELCLEQPMHLPTPGAPVVMRSGVLYEVEARPEHVALQKRLRLSEVAAYHGSEDYGLLVLTPLGRPQLTNSPLVATQQV